MKTFSFSPLPWSSKPLFNCRLQFLTSTELAREQVRKLASDPVRVLCQAPLHKEQKGTQNLYPSERGHPHYDSARIATEGSFM